MWWRGSSKKLLFDHFEQPKSTEIGGGEFWSFWPPTSINFFQWHTTTRQRTRWTQQHGSTTTTTRHQQTQEHNTTRKFDQPNWLNNWMRPKGSSALARINLKKMGKRSRTYWPRMMNCKANWMTCATRSMSWKHKMPYFEWEGPSSTSCTQTQSC